MEEFERKNESLEQQTGEPALRDIEQKVQITTMHKVCGGIVLLTAFFAILWMPIFLTTSEETWMGVIKATIEHYRDVNKPGFANKTDEEIGSMIEENRGRLLKEITKQVTIQVIIKGVLAIFLIITGVGILKAKRSPTRIFAIILGIIFLIAFFVMLSDSKLKLYEKFDAPFSLVFVEYVWFILLPINAVACFIAFAILKKPAAGR